MHCLQIWMDRGDARRNANKNMLCSDTPSSRRPLASADFARHALRNVAAPSVEACRPGEVLGKRASIYHHPILRRRCYNNCWIEQS